MVNKNSHIPIYVQIEEELKHKIYLGEYKVGELIPSERKLSVYFGVSRMTVRQAITNLVSTGQLYREKGRGTYVATPKLEQPLTGLTSFTEDMYARGLVPSTKVVKFEKQIPPFDVAQDLLLNADEEVYFMVRIRNADQEPMAIERTYIPVKVLPDLTEKLVSESLYKIVEEVYGLAIGNAKQQMEAANVAKEDGKFLKLEPSAVVLTIKRISLLKNGQPFEVVQSAYRADRYKFTTEIQR